MASTDYYKVLGVSQKCSEEDLKKAYKSLAKQYHPDKNKDPGAEEKFKEIGTAYETLKDNEKRRVYDLQKDTEELRSRREKEQAKNKRTGGNSAGGSTFTFSAPAGSSFKFSQNGANFTFQTTFTNFGTDRHKEEEKQEKNKNKKKKTKPTKAEQRTFDFTRPEWNSHFAEESASEDDMPGMFSFTLNHGFRDPFEEMDTVFDKFFQDPFFDTGMQDIFGSSFPRRREPVKKVGNKKKKDPMADMYDWSKPMFPGKRGCFEDEDFDVSYESDEDISKYKFPCSYCGRKFQSAEVHKHEEICRRIYSGHAKTGGSQFKPDKEKTKSKVEENDVDEDYDQPAFRRSHDWRQEHEELKANVRQAKRASRAKKEAKVQPDVQCEWCGQSFDEDGAVRHMAHCRRRSAEREEPMTSRGSDVHARMYGSKTSQAREYAKNIPKPKTTKTTNKTSKSSQDSQGDAGKNTGTSRASPSRSSSAQSQKPSASRTSATSSHNYSAFHGRTNRKK